MEAFLLAELLGLRRARSPQPSSGLGEEARRCGAGGGSGRRLEHPGQTAGAGHPRADDCRSVPH